MNASKKIRVIAALGTLSGAVWAGTFATFTDSAASTAAFSTGTVDLVGNGDPDDAFATAGLTMSGAKPGEFVYGEMAINNAGTLPFTYDLATTTTDDTTSSKPAGLGAALQMSVKRMVASGTCTDLLWAGHTTVALDVTSLKDNGFATARPLGAGATEYLCVRVELPSTTGDNLQGAATSAAFTFSATQQ